MTWILEDHRRAEAEGRKYHRIGERQSGCVLCGVWRQEGYRLCGGETPYCNENCVSCNGNHSTFQEEGRS